MDDLGALRALVVATSREPAGTTGWSHAVLRRQRQVAGYLVDVQGQRVVPLPDGTVLLANEARLAEHDFPARWFEASFVLVSLSEGVARVSDARATNAAQVHGSPLPRASWSSPPGEADAAALVTGDAAARIARLQPAWREIREGDTVVATFPAVTWVFLWAIQR